MRPPWAFIAIILGLFGGISAQNVTYRWVYRNPYSILDPKAVDNGMGSRNGTVNSLLSSVPDDYEPRLRYDHMATLAHLPNGSIAAQWQANTKWFEGAANQSIYWAITDDYGATWGPTRLLVPSPDGLPLWGPVQYSANDTMHLWYSKSHAACEWTGASGVVWAPGGDLLFSTSKDTSKTMNTTTIVPWSYEGGVARLTCNGVSLNAKGEWLLPYWRELGGPSVCQNKPSLHGTAGVLITGDQGKTYTKVNVPKDNSTWMIENAIARYGANASFPDMHLQTFRTSTGTALQSWSSDGGFNWTLPVNSTLPNPNSRMDIISLPNNTLVAAFNDSPSKRTPLRLATSVDGGVTWIRQALIEDDPVGSFHYPALLYDAKKDIVMCIYTVGYPPRLVPVSLILPSLDVKATSAFDNATATAAAAPAPAPSANATAPAPGERAVYATPSLSNLSNLTGRVTGVNLTLPGYPMGNASASHALKSLQAVTQSATSNRTSMRAPAPAPSSMREAEFRRGEGDVSRDTLSRATARAGAGRRHLAQAASSQRLAASQGKAVAVHADDVLANMEGGLDDDMSADEMARNAALAEEHAELLTAHGYRLVDGLPGYVLEPVSREVRKLNIQSFQSGPHGEGADGHGMSDEELGADKDADENAVLGRRRRLLKDRYVKELSDYGRVSYGMRMATVDRLDLVNGLISPK